MNKFGTILKKAREASGLSQRDLADRMEIKSGKQTISRWELDKSEPSYSELKKLATVLDVPIASLFADQEEGIDYGLDGKPSVKAYGQNEPDSMGVGEPGIASTPISKEGFILLPAQEILDMQRKLIKHQEIQLARFWKNEG